MFRCPGPALTIAACLSTRSPFMSPLEKRFEADAAKRSFSLGCSDHLTLLAAYAGWCHARAEGWGAERAFLGASFLSRAALVAIEQTREQFRALLEDIGFATKPAQRQPHQRARGKGKGGHRGNF